MQGPGLSLRFFLQIILVEFLLFGGLRLVTNAPTWLYFAIAAAALVVLVLVETGQHRWLLDWSWPNRPNGQHHSRRDRSFSHAMRYVATRRWPDEADKSIGGKTDDLKRLAEQIWQQAIDQKITIWGRRAKSNVHVPMPADYLVSRPVSVMKHVVNMPSLDAALKTTLGEPEPPSDDYTDLMVSKTEIEAVWPPKG